jgi:hypothetical protein
LYGETLEVSFLFNGGWFPFVLERSGAKSSDNVLFEIDNQPAVDL